MLEGALRVYLQLKLQYRPFLVKLVGLNFKKLLLKTHNQIQIIIIEEFKTNPFI